MINDLISFCCCCVVAGGQRQTFFLLVWFVKGGEPFRHAHNEPLNIQFSVCPNNLEMRCFDPERFAWDRNENAFAKFLRWFLQVCHWEVEPWKKDTKRFCKEQWDHLRFQGNRLISGEFMMRKIDQKFHRMHKLEKDFDWCGSVPSEKPKHT